MPRPDHYRILGVPPDASIKLIKARYRELARKLHPDVNKQPGATDRFRELTESYQLLLDPELRGHYDALRRLDEQRRKAAPAPPRTAPKRTQPTRRAVSEARVPEGARGQIAAAQRLFAQGRLTEAERLAQAVTRAYRGVGAAYAVLGDVYRLQQRFERAAKMYALAIQFDPSDPSLERRYEQILDELQQAKAVHATPDAGELRRRQVALGLSLLVHPPFLAYVTFVHGDPAHLLGIVDFWTWGLVFALLLDGVACGAVMSATGQLARWESLGSHGGTISGVAVYGPLGALCFWAAVIYYGVIGVLQDSFTPSLSRVFGWCCGLTVAFTIAFATQQPSGWAQVLMWGGNLLFVGTLVGWRLADAFRR